MNRRQFLLGAPALAVASEVAGARTFRKIRHVDIVHHTHTDVGYTDLPVVVRELQKEYIDRAMAACRADARFRWTVESLLEMDDWWRDAMPVRRQEFLRLVDAGSIDVMGMPFNQTPFLNARQWRQMMSWIPQSLWKQLRIRAAMQNDVNGMPRAGAKALLDAGISHLLMGLNADSGGPPFARPSAFWWKQPDGRRMFVWHGEHYGSSMAYLAAARDGDRLRDDEESVRAAHAGLVTRMQKIEQGGYPYDRLILTFTHPRMYDNGWPFPTLAPFIASWNRLALEPSLRLANATTAVFEMEKAIGAVAPERSGEWTDWWANGDASGPREVAASRRAKRDLAVAESAAFGPMPESGKPLVEKVLRDLCLFDEHTWGASDSISAPYSLNTQGQTVEKSDLAYRPMGLADLLVRRRVETALQSRAAGVYAINASGEELSGWANVKGEAKARRVWLEKLPPHSLQQCPDEPPTSTDLPEIRLDANGWPQAVTWPGMRSPLFDGALANFLAVDFVPPADRRTILRLHSDWNAERRRAAIRETPAAYGASQTRETAHTLVYEQEVRHSRLANAKRTVELWRGEPRVRVTVQFDRISSIAPEVLFLDFAFPVGVPLPVFASGGMPYTPYRDQLPGSCRDYFGIDGWAHYAMPEGHWLWVTRDAPLVAVGGPHVVERHQQEPADHRRILAMVFDNCWHTNFVADSHGTMEFQFDLVWRARLERPAELAAALSTDPIVYRHNG